jgi:G3E family GTPase
MTFAAALSEQLSLAVVVVSGAVGVGKTSLLNCLLAQQPTLRAAVVVCDAGPASALPHGPGLASITHVQEKPMRLALGNECLRVRSDLLVEASRLAGSAAYDCLLIENSSHAEAAPAAHTFAASLHQPAYGLHLAAQARLTALVTVVDASQLLADLWTADLLSTTPDLAVADVLIEQIEQAQVLLINKIDLVSPVALADLCQLLRQLNPTAQLLTTTHGQVAAELLLGATHPVAGAVAPDPAAYCFHDERPFHPERLWQFVHESWPREVVRSRGTFWLASRPDEVLSWSQAGLSQRMAPVGTWWAAVPDRRRDPAYRREEAALLARWHPVFQDRCTELFFSGIALDAAQLHASLNACLCTPLEISRWRRGHSFADPWPRNT